MTEAHYARLTTDFFAQDATESAPLFLGKLLCRRIGDTVLRARITETECYYGETDTACHAHKGRTPRTETLYLSGGHAYIYLCYGMHHLLNFVTGPADHPQAVLIRAVEGTVGPGRLTKALHIDRTLNRENCITSTLLWLEDDAYRPASVEATPRIGIGYASPEDRVRLWRYVAK